MGLKGDSRSGSLGAAASGYTRAKPPAGQDLSVLLCRMKSSAVGSAVEHVACGEEGNFFVQLFHDQQRTSHLTQSLSETQGAALGLNALSFPT